MERITESVGRLSSFEEELKAELRKQICGLIEEVPKKPRCFTVRVKDLSPDRVLCPSYYDSAYQFKIVLEKLEKQNLYTFLNTIKNVISTGKLDGERVHPSTIQKLESIV